MTDVPYGRGGSPLQNLIARGVYDTQISALRCEAQVDAGPVYLKRPFSLREGSAQALYQQASAIIEEMIVELLASQPTPVPQCGDATIFARRKPYQSNLAGVRTAHQIYDHIRMLDAPGYPPAFLQVDGLHLSFRDAILSEDAQGVTATVVIRPIESEDVV
ncbi:MAG: hypothetical protein IPK79_09490 [Vampirovibrionales bacterium]|nr:hypothetical protein [Vampirovibrionales bacterium]